NRRDAYLVLAMRRRAFTLLEVLAAVVLLGILASATVPMMLHLGRNHDRLTDRKEAAAALAAMTRASKLVDASSLPGHPNWQVQQVALAADPPSPPPVGVVPQIVPVHQWRWLVVRDGMGADAPILAERMVLVLPEAKR